MSFNDLIKINDNKIVFVSSSADREKLYITTLDISREKKVRIRYYLIEIFALYSRKIYKDLRIHNYNGFITCGISYCPTDDCPDSSSAPHYSTLMIFSYPNSNDLTISIEGYIYNDNSLDLLNLKFNITKQLTIENNIFGYILAFIKIVKIEGVPNEYKAFSSKIRGNEIREDFLMTNDDYIIFQYTGGEKYVPKVNKQIEYYFIVTEPDYNTYESYTYDVEGENDQNAFERKEYIGKNSFYNIKSDNELSFECSDSNCHICLKDHKEKCLSCLYNYNLSGDSYKDCLEQEEPLDVETTLIPTILTTTPTTEPITTILTTEPITTILTTEPITTILTTEAITTIPSTEAITTIPTTEPISKISIIEPIKTIPTIEPISKTFTIEPITTIPTTEPIIESSTQISSIESIKIITTIITQKVDYKTEEITGKITEILTEEITEKKTEEIKEIITEEMSNNVNNCSKADILNNKCSYGQLTEAQVSQAYTQLKKDILNSDYKGNNTIIQTENVVIQISTLNDQKNSDNPDISSIDLGDCEQELKTYYGITEDLIIFKIDMKSEDLTQTYVQYEVYHPTNFTSLNLSVCKDMKISVNSPVKLDSSISELYDSLKDFGYDLFNESSEFYTDICSTYTSANGTDMTLNDRKKEIFSAYGNLSLCQSGCELDYYNSTTKKAKCDCSPQVEETEPVLSTSSSKFSAKMISESFMNTLKNSNFLVLKCYKLAIDLKSLWKNIGRILMTIILFLSLIMLVMYCFSDSKKIDVFIKSILNKKIYDMSNNNSNEKKQLDNKKPAEKNKKYNSRNSREKIKRNSGKNKSFSENNVFLIKKKHAPPKKNISFMNRKNKSINSKNDIVSNSKINLNDELHKRNFKRKSSKRCGSNINIVRINNYHIKNFFKGKKKKSHSLKMPSIKSAKNNLKLKLKTKEKKEKNVNYISNKHNFHINTANKNNGKLNDNLQKPLLNDQELNSLEYNLAILYDKRTYFQYYWSLLKRKQLILFTFIPAEDYNLFSIKICLFLLSFSLYFTINGFFFSDETMHKIHEDKGKFNILYQIPQILYSSIISSVINVILKQLSLSERNILSLKQEKDVKQLINYSKKIKACILIKFIIFIFLNLSFLLFFWYFISCFCAVYKNTQIILIKDTIVSFGLSMLYPFGLNLLPGIFRIPSLREKDKKCLYQFSTLVALI